MKKDVSEVSEDDFLNISDIGGITGLSTGIAEGCVNVGKIGYEHMGYNVGGIAGRSFDGRGNYNIGVKEQIIFPEIEYDKVDMLRGLNISITTTAKTDEEAKALLQAFRFPFKN